MSSDFSNVNNHLKKWLIPLSLSKKFGMKKILELFIESLRQNNLEILSNFRTTVKIISDLTDQKEQNVASAGGGCFFANILMSLSLFGVVKDVEKMSALTCCYLYLDHVMDSKNLSEEYKTKFVQEVKKIITGEPSDSTDNVISESLRNFKIMIQHSDKNIENRNRQLSKLLYLSQVKSTVVQSNKNLTYEDYYSMAMEKGKYTALLAASVMGLKQEDYDKFYDNLSLVGGCCQLIDDVFDVYDDIDADIESVASYCLKKDNNLDRLIVDIFRIFDAIDCKFNIIRYAFLFILTYSVSKNFNTVSSRIRLILDPYTYFDYKTGLNLENIIVSAFSRE